MKLEHLFPELKVDTTLFDLVDELGCSGVIKDIAKTIAKWKVENQDNSSMYDGIELLLSDLSLTRLNNTQIWRIFTDPRNKRGLKDRNLKYIEEMLDLYELKFVMDKISINATLEDLEKMDAFSMAGKGIAQAWKGIKLVTSLATIANSRKRSLEEGLHLFNRNLEKAFGSKKSPQARLLNLILDRYHQKFSGRLIKKNFPDSSYTYYAKRLEETLVEIYPGYGKEGLSEYEAYHLFYINTSGPVKEDIKKRMGRFNPDRLFFSVEELAPAE